MESVISEGSGLGACWAMSGSRGLVTVQLPREITVDGFSLEHASRMVTPESGSAPKEFQVCLLFIFVAPALKSHRRHFVHVSVKRRALIAVEWKITPGTFLFFLSLL